MPSNPAATADLFERAAPLRRLAARVLCSQAQVLWLMQRCDQAQACAHRALPLLRLQDDAASLARAHATLAQVHLHEAGHRPALAWERLALATRHDLPALAARAWANLATLGMVHRRLDQVLLRCAQGIAWCEAHELDLFEVRLRIRRAHAWLMRGHWDRADDEAACTVALPGLNAIEREQAQHLRPLVALRRLPDAPTLQPAWADLIDGLSHLAVDPWHAPLALTRVEAAWLLGRHDTARQLAQQVRRSLRRAGARGVPRGPDRAARCDPLGLTARERGVWHWLSRGLSNRAIAEQLHRSERTVEHHAPSLLAKLGSSDRHAAQQRRQAAYAA